MNNFYYYIIATLPYLSFQQKPSSTPEIFQDYCSSWCSSADMAIIRGEGKHQHSFHKVWKSFNSILWSQLQDIRQNNKKGLSAEPDVRKILAKVNPLQTEIAYELFRWNFLEAQDTEFYSLKHLLIYQEKLIILIRLNQFNNENGNKVAETMLEALYDKTIS